MIQQPLFFPFSLPRQVSSLRLLPSFPLQPSSLPYQQPLEAGFLSLMEAPGLHNLPPPPAPPTTISAMMPPPETPSYGGVMAGMMPPPIAPGPIITITARQGQHASLPCDITLRVHLTANPLRKELPRPYSITRHDLTRRFSHVLARADYLWSSPDSVPGSQLTHVKYGPNEDDVEFQLDRGKAEPHLIGFVMIVVMT